MACVADDNLEMMIHSNTEPEKKTKETKMHELVYGVDQWPPIAISIAVAFQHLICCVTVVITMTYTISDIVCIPAQDPIRTRIFCSSMLMVGIATVIQTLIGIRLPVIQGSSMIFLSSIIAMKTRGIWQCSIPNGVPIINGSGIQNTTTVTQSLDEQTKYDRLNELQGSLMLASVLEVFIGATGLIGLIFRFIGPITIAVTITLMGQSLYPVAIYYSDSSWPIAMTGTLLMIIFGVYLVDVKISLPRCLRKTGSQKKSYSVFDTFAIIFSITITWILCWLLTMNGVFPNDPSDATYWARTDTRISLIREAPWFLFPYPGQFGAPRFSMPLFIGYLPIIMLTTMESVGDYFTISMTCNAVPLPRHAVNRGILVEGIMSILSSSFGNGHATTSYSTVAPIIAITKVGSRYSVAIAGVIAMVLAIFGKLGGVMTSMPNPVIGGYFIFVLAVVVSLGLSELRHVDMTSSRNISVVGLSIFIPIIGAEWLNRNQGQINTGYEQLDSLIEIILGSPIVVGATIALILDNTVKGTKEERGFKPELVNLSAETQDYSAVVSHGSRSYLYDVPYVDKFQGRLKFLRHFPFIQKFDADNAE